MGRLCGKVQADAVCDSWGLSPWRRGALLGWPPGLGGGLTAALQVMKPRGCLRQYWVSFCFWIVFNDKQGHSKEFEGSSLLFAILGPFDMLCATAPETLLA